MGRWESNGERVLWCAASDSADFSVDSQTGEPSADPAQVLDIQYRGRDGRRLKAQGERDGTLKHERSPLRPGHAKGIVT